MSSDNLASTCLSFVEKQTSVQEVVVDETFAKHFKRAFCFVRVRVRVK